MSRERRTGDPYEAVRNELKMMRDDRKQITGDRVYGVLDVMYQARLKKLGPHVDPPHEFVFPGSNGLVRIEYVPEIEKTMEAHNVWFVGADGKERGVAVTRQLDPEKRGGGAVLGTILEVDEIGVSAYYNFTKSVHGLSFIRRENQDLPGELMTALNYLHKPSRGQTTRPQGYIDWR